MSRWLPRLAAVLLAVPAATWGVLVVYGTPASIVAGALVPAALYAVLVLWVQRGEGRPWLLLAFALLWGAVGAALLANTLNDLARAWMVTLAGAGSARALTATAVAPAVEEAAKAIGLLMLLAARRDAIATPRDGIVYGALVGIGFVAAENLVYLGFAALQGGEPGLQRAIWLRGVLAGLNHAVFTATIGAGIGATAAIAAPAARGAVVTIAVAAALAQHLAWNALAANALTHVLCGAPTPDAACLPAPTTTTLVLTAPALIALFLGPGAAALAAVARHRARDA